MHILSWFGINGELTCNQSAPALLIGGACVRSLPVRAGRTEHGVSLSRTPACVTPTGVGSRHPAERDLAGLLTQNAEAALVGLCRNDNERQTAFSQVMT